MTKLIALSIFQNQIKAPGGLPSNLSKTSGNYGLGIVRFALDLLFVFAVIFALIMILIAALAWITSGGDKTKLDSARSHIVAAIVGLVIALLAYLIINVVLTIFGVGNGLSNFTLPTLSQ